MKKLSVIRNTSIHCPYGLPILSACKEIGTEVLDMTSIDESIEPQQAIKNNLLLYSKNKSDKRCLFANKIMNKFNAVDCSWGDEAAGEGSMFLPSSSLYPRNFVGYGLDSSNDNRQQVITDPRLTFEGPQKGIDVPVGLFSIFSDYYNESNIIKAASKYTNKSINIQHKLATLKSMYFDTLKLIIPDDSIIKLNEEQLEKMLLIIDDWTK